MAKPIATVGGIALAPGVSRNGRLYTRKAIAGLVARAHEIGVERMRLFGRVGRALCRLQRLRDNLAAEHAAVAELDFFRRHAPDLGRQPRHAGADLAGRDFRRHAVHDAESGVGHPLGSAKTLAEGYRPQTQAADTEIQRERQSALET